MKRPNQSLQPTPVGHLNSAFAVDITDPAWLSFIRWRALHAPNMKTFILLLASMAFVTGDALSESPVTAIAIQLAIPTNNVWLSTDHKSVEFMCTVTIDNQTHAPLTLTNITLLFEDPSGLALKVSDHNGVELSRLTPLPFIDDSKTIAAGSKGFFAPFYRWTCVGSDSTVRIQLEGRLIGSSYSGSITSNVEMLKIPK